MSGELNKKIDDFLAKYCTGMDDHDETNCHKCREMKEDLVALLESLLLTK